MLGQGQAKGSIFIHLQSFVRKRKGVRAWEDLLERTGPRDREVLESLLIVGGWYPVGAWNRALDTFLPASYDRPDDGMRDLAAYIADADLNRLYKMVLSMGSPEFLMKRTPSLWNRYFDEGDLAATEIDPRRWSLTLNAPRGIEEAPGYFTCGPGVSAWIELGLKRTGVEATVIHEKCRFDRARSCEYVVTW
jgi:hypothetical protein